MNIYISMEGHLKLPQKSLLGLCGLHTNHLCYLMIYTFLEQHLFGEQGGDKCAK